MFSRHTASLVACALLASTAPHAPGHTTRTVLLARVGEPGDFDSKTVSSELGSGKVKLSGDYGNYAIASGSSSLTASRDSCAVRMNARVKCNAGPTFWEKDFQVHNGAAAVADLTRDRTFTFAEDTRFTLRYMLAREAPWRIELTVPNGATISVTIERLLPDGSREEVFQQSIQDYPYINSDAGTLPAGTYRVTFSTHLAASWVGARAPLGMAEGAVETAARIDFGPVSKAVVEWRKTIGEFSDLALGLRSTADSIAEKVPAVNELLATAAETLPPVFDEAFEVTPHRRLENQFFITPRDRASFAAFQLTQAHACRLYREFDYLRDSLTWGAKEAAERGYFPRAILLDLKWKPIDWWVGRNLTMLPYYDGSDSFFKETVDHVRTDYNASRKWFSGVLPLLPNRLSKLDGMGDFIISNIGLSAEEIIRQIKADKRLDSRERDMLIGSLNMADWAWREQ